MKNSLRLILVAMVVLLIQIDAVGNGKTMSGDQEITPDPEIQAQIRCITSAIDNSEEAKKQLEKLKQMVAGQYEKLVPQVIYYTINTKGDIYDAMAGAIIFSALQISKETIVGAIVPYLGTSDFKLKKELEEYLDGIDTPHTLGPRDYSYYESFIKEKKKNPPLPLIQYMYQKSPKETQSVLRRIYVEGPGAGGTIPPFVQAVLNRSQ